MFKETLVTLAFFGLLICVIAFKIKQPPVKPLCNAIETIKRDTLTIYELDCSGHVTLSMHGDTIIVVKK